MLLIDWKYAYWYIGSFKLLIHFLCCGIISACFKQNGKIEDFIKLLILSQMKI